MTFSILLSRNFRFLIVFGLIAFVSATASASLIVSFETSGGTLAYGTWDTTTLSQTGVTLLPTTGDTRGLGIDGSGNVYVGRVSGSGQSTIYKYDASGALQTTSSTINVALQDFAFSTDGIFRSSFETSGGTLAYGTWDTTTLSQTGVTLLPTTGDTRGLGIDGSGNVYIGRVSGSGQSTIYKYDASGALLLTSSTINATIEGFAFAPTAVPEPSSFALMMVALTGAAIGRFRKRRK